MSFIATVLAILLTTFGVNLAEPSQVNTAQPMVTLQPAASSQPTDVPQASQAPTAAPSAEATALAPFVTDAQTVQDTQMLLTGIYMSVIQGTPYQLPENALDNADTHTIVRWAEYLLASTTLSDAGKLTAFNRPGITPAFKSAYMNGERLVSEVECGLSLRTQGNTDYTAKLSVMLTYERVGEDTQITAISISGDSMYDALKAAIPAGADVAAIDAAADALISALG